MQKLKEWLATIPDGKLPKKSKDGKIRRICSKYLWMFCITSVVGN
jgi:hypothetical protein